MAYYEIPLDNTPFCERSFRVSIENNTRNVHVKLLLYYLDLYDYWKADIYNGDNNELLVAGVPLVLGVNILGAHGYIDMGEAYIIENTESGLMHPDNNTLGTTFSLIWGDST